MTAEKLIEYIRLGLIMIGSSSIVAILIRNLFKTSRPIFVILVFIIGIVTGLFIFYYVYFTDIYDDILTTLGYYSEDDESDDLDEENNNEQEEKK